MHLQDFDTDDLIPENDNHPSPLRRRVPRYVTEGQTDVLLALAGFDPDKIPRKLHTAALKVAFWLRHGLYSPSALTHACNLSKSKLARTLVTMHTAQKGRAA